ncbi:MAG: glycosyltransferase [Actinomycetota bacterium]|nr:glycosyltransferase [Actinomycetota bacterium]
MAKNPLVSIIICTHNRAKLLRDAVAGSIAQRYSPAEIVVIDDGSADNTSEVAAEFGNHVTYFRREKKSMESAINLACKELANGEFIAINDDDDLMHPDRITILYDALSRYPQAVLAIGEAEMLDAEGNRTGFRTTLSMNGIKSGPVLIENGYKAILWPRISPTTCATLFRKRDGERAGWYDERFTRCGDTDFFGRLALLGPVVYVPRTVAYYRKGHQSKWSNNDINNMVCEYNNILLFEKHLGLANGNREMKKRLQERMLHSMKRLAFLEQKTGGMPEDIRRDRLITAISVLNASGRIAYQIYKGLKLPVRSILKKAFWQLSA